MSGYTGFGLVVLFLLGYFLDQRLRTGLLYSLVGLSLGFAYIVYEIWKMTRKK